MASLMGRAGASASATSRALSNGGRISADFRTSRRDVRGQEYLSILNLRRLHGQLVAALDYHDNSPAAGPEAMSSISSASGSDGSSRYRGGRGGGSVGGKWTPMEIAKHEAQLVEIIRSIAELVALGEAREEPEYFEFFCDKSTMTLFVSALRFGAAVKTQVVQAVSVLFQNLKDSIHLYMLLSQDHINRLIQPDVAVLPLQDEEFLSNYVALLKAISVRLGADTVQFFLNTTKGSFPLYSRSVPLIAHPDPMVRTSALSIVLHVFSVRDPGVVAFLAQEENHAGFFAQLSRLLQDAYSQLLCRVWQSREPASSAGLTAMDEFTSLFQDILYYVQDVLEAADSWLSGKLATHLHRNFFRPVVLDGLAEAFEVGSPHGNDDETKIKEPEEEAVEAGREDREAEVMVEDAIVRSLLVAQLSLYVLCQLFMLVANGSLVKQVTLDLFGCGSSAGQTEAAAKAGGDSASNHETEAGISTVSDEAEEMESTGRWNRGKAEHRPRSPSPHPPRGLRYQRALLATLSEHGGSGNKLGAAAAVSVVRCAANNPVAAETLCAFKAWGGADAESGGGEMTETLEVECSAMAAEASENRGSRACGDPRAEQPDPASLAVAVPRRESLEGGREKGAGEGAQRLGDDGSVERWETSGERSLEAGEPTAESGGGGDDDRTESTIEDREGSLKRNVGVNVTRGAPAVLSFLSGRSQQPERVCCNGGGDEGGGASARRTRNEGFEQVVMHLLEALADAAADDTLVIRNVGATVAELCIWDLGDCYNSSYCSGDSSARKGGVREGEGVHGIYFGPWRTSGRLQHQRFEEALTSAYARSAVMLLQTTTRSHPFALLAACERAVELLGVGVGMDGAVRVSSPPPPLAAVAVSGMLLVGNAGPAAVKHSIDGLRGFGVDEENEEAAEKRAVAFLILRHLHRWLIKGAWSPPSTSITAATNGSTRMIAALPPTASIYVDAEFLALVGVDVVASRQAMAGGTPREKETPKTTPPGSASVQTPPPSARVGGRIRLSCRRCVACCLPYKWPAVQSVIPPRGPTKTPTFSSSLELYVVLDDRDFLVAEPDPDSPLDNGRILCAAQLRNAVARPHPANPRVLELRVSTRETSQARANGGPGLFLPTTSPAAVASRYGVDGDGGASFRGVGHKGLWHLVLTFQSAAACALVAGHVEEQREAALAARTVGMVELFRRAASAALTPPADGTRTTSPQR